MAKSDTTPEPQNVTLTFEQLKELLGSRQEGLSPETLAAILAKTAEISATSMQKAMKPENTTHPGVSFGSYPEGDVARPRPVLPFKVLWKGFPVDREPELSTWWELEGYASLKPGRYTVSRRDGAPLLVDVTAKYGPDGTTIEQISVEFDCDRDVRSLIAPPYIMCYQMAHADQDRQETFVEAMSSMMTIELRDRQAKRKLVAA